MNLRSLVSMVSTAIGLLLIAIMFSAFAGGDSGGNLEGTFVGQKVRQIAGTDSDGQRVSLEDYAGKVVIIDFWASWCGPCRKTHPMLNQIQEDLGSRGAQVIGVNLDSSIEQLRKYEVEAGLNFPSIHGGGEQLAQEFGVSAIPTIIIVDRQGVIQFRGHGGNIRETVVGLLSVQ